MNADGKNVRQITDTTISSTAPRFSPDGSLLAFNQKSGADSAIYMLSANGGAPKRVSPADLWSDYPAWSANGEEIYFTARENDVWNLWKIKINGGDAVQITQNGAFLAAPAPDGRYVYFKKESDDKELWRVLVNGGAEQKLPEFTHAGFFGSWMMQKTGIYFPVRCADQTYYLKFYDFADRQMKDTAGDFKIPSNLDSADYSTSDGKELLCTILENPSHLRVAEFQ